ncbi:hypothetical protein D1872_245830 [compost metagenome]
MAEGLPFVGSVDVSRFIQVFRHGLQPRQEDQHGIAHVHPDLYEDDVTERMRKAGKKHIFIAEQLVVQHIDRAAHRIEHHAPDQSDNGHPQDDREEKDGSVEVIPA